MKSELSILGPELCKSISLIAYCEVLIMPEPQSVRFLDQAWQEPSRPFLLCMIMACVLWGAFTSYLLASNPPANSRRSIQSGLSSQEKLWCIVICLVFALSLFASTGNKLLQLLPAGLVAEIERKIILMVVAMVAGWPFTRRILADWDLTIQARRKPQDAGS